MAGDYGPVRSVSPLVTVFGLELPAWHLWVCLGAVLGWFYAGALARSLCPPLLDALPLLFAASYGSGLLGARALGYVSEGGSLSLLVPGPMTFYGGVAGGLVAGLAVCRVRALDVRRALDCTVPPLVLGLALGRIGCFFNGCDYGVPAPPPWGLPSQGGLRFPSQLEESLASFVIAGTAGMSARRQPAPGFLGLTTAIASLVHRVWAEELRADPRGLFPGTPWTTSQGLGFLLACAALWALWRVRPDP